MWINTAISGNWQWLWFSIPLSKKRVNYILESIKKYWTIKRPLIWINYLPITDAVASQLWLKVNYWWYISNWENNVLKWSSAEKAWISAWDIILEVDWQKITLDTPIQNIIQNKIPGDTLNLKILKNNWEEKNIQIILGEY
jgi:S1-C subfamily serine protease